MADNFNILDRAGSVYRRFTTGRYYQVWNMAGDTTLVTTQSQLTVAAFPVDVAATFDRVTLEVTATAVGSTFRVGIYNDNGNGLPGTLVAELATLDTASATGVISAVISLALPPGLYWLGGAAQGGAPTVRARSLGSSPFVSQADGANVNGTGYTQSSVTGALPNPIVPSSGPYQGASPKVMLRAV